MAGRGRKGQGVCGCFGLEGCARMRGRGVGGWVGGGGGGRGREGGGGGLLH